MAYRPTDYILVMIRITIRIRESVPDHDPDPGRTATILLCWRPAEVWVHTACCFNHACLSVLCVRHAEWQEEGHPRHSADDTSAVSFHVDVERLCVFWPTDRHLFQQPQTSLLQCQPQGGRLHVSTQLRRLSRQVKANCCIDPVSHVWRCSLITVLLKFVCYNPSLFWVTGRHLVGCDRIQNQIWWILSIFSQIWNPAALKSCWCRIWMQVSVSFSLMFSLYWISNLLLRREFKNSPETNPNLYLNPIGLIREIGIRQMRIFAGSITCIVFGMLKVTVTRNPRGLLWGRA